MTDFMILFTGATCVVSDMTYASNSWRKKKKSLGDNPENSSYIFVVFVWIITQI